MTKKKSNKTNSVYHHRRQRLDTVFSYQDDIQLAMGILQYGNKWKYIWKEKNLTHIPYSSLKDRARSKTFKELMDRIIVQQQQNNRHYWNTNLEKSTIVRRRETTNKQVNHNERKSIRIVEKQPFLSDYPSKDILSDLSDDDDDDDDTYEPKTYLDIQLRPPCPTKQQQQQQQQTTLSPTFRYWHQPIITEEDIRKENEAYL